MKIKFYIIISSLLFCLNCRADTENIINKLFGKWSDTKFPGCAVAVVKNQKVIYKQCFGLADLQYKIPITPETVFAGASLSKQFTAFAVALLIEKGKINLNDKIKKYLSWLPDIADDITVGNLIYHTDGLRDQWDLLTFAGWNLYTDSASNEDVLNLIGMQQKLNFIPETEYLYGNTGYTLLAQIVEKVSGRTFPAFCKEKIFKPLGMKHTFFNKNYKKIIPDLAQSYLSTYNKNYIRCPYNISTYGATGIYTTLDDLIKWSNNFHSHKLGGIETYKLITKTGILRSGKNIHYGFGLEIKKYKGLNYFAHAGADAGYNNFFITFPQENTSIIVLSNSNSINANTIAFKIADILFPTGSDKHKDFNNPKGICNFGAFAGYYFSKDTGTELNILNNATKEFCVELMGKKFKLKRIDNNIFCISVMPSVIFKFDPKGKLLEYNNRVEGIAITLTKVKKDNLKINPLTGYVGKYYCPELDVTYRVQYLNNKLIMERPRFTKSQLTPVFKDYFNATNGFWGLPYSIIFIRNEKTQIIGFNISTSIVTNRVRNLHFEKIK